MKRLGSLLLRTTLVALLALVLTPARAQAPHAGTPLDNSLAQQVRSLALAATHRAAQDVIRVEVEVGTLDARLRLAPCERVQPYLPAAARLWGKSRIGLRCTQGASRWNVFVPVTVKVYAKALVAATPLPAGAVLTAADVRQAEVDLAEDASAAVTDTGLAVGRTLARALNAGQSVRVAHLKARQWFAAGDVVTVAATGSGFSVASQAHALTPGMEGQSVRVRTESGRVLTGLAVAEHRVELYP